MSETRYLAVKVVMMPRDTNPYGTIFGGVIMSYIDQAGLWELAIRSSNRDFLPSLWSQSRWKVSSFTSRCSLVIPSASGLKCGGSDGLPSRCMCRLKPNVIDSCDA